MDDSDTVEMAEAQAFTNKLVVNLFGQSSEVTKHDFLQAIVKEIGSLLPHAKANLHPGSANIVKVLWLHSPPISH